MSKQLINRFTEKCKALKDGKFLMSKDRIAGILRLLASDEDMIELIKACNKNFDYSMELHHCTSYLGGSKIFKLPSSPHKVTALVTGLLYDFDRRPNDFNLFLKDYFPADSPNAQFKTFYENIIEPYRLAVTDILERDDRRPTFEDEEEKPKLISEALKEQFFPLIDGLTTEVLAAALPEQKAKECVDVLEGFYYAIETADERLVRAMWLGAKNTILPCRIGESYIRSVDKVFESYL